ncbi:flagellar hook-basal body protein [Acetivibrio cellulolyticus]|uniref:flagellar hook-basal body protein n=1 Tax=Acetivibrio cellulolyticus TaxID=35830 RepID=UPI0001E2CC2F|nr:flagellar hook-basal body protein [Acetivibrio cellulolyticus]
MIRALYTSGWSMNANNKQMDVISNNLANVSTNGYKKDTVVYESFPNALVRRVNDTESTLNPSGKVGDVQLGNDVGQVFTYYTSGQLASTGNNLDLAIGSSDSAFFTIGVPSENGELTEYYTRDGSFCLNSAKQLVTSEGYMVMGTDGPITLESENFSVLDDGSIVQNGQVVDKLAIKDFTDTSTLRKFGENLIQTTEETQEQEFNGVVKQGYLEQSNVNVVNEMINMITVMRAYESNQKVIQALDGTLEKAVNEVGAVR